MAIQQAEAPSLDEQHQIAAEHAIGWRMTTILHDDTHDPAALARDIDRFTQAGYHVEFLAVATPDIHRELNSLWTQLCDPRGLPVSDLARSNLAVCANEAEANGLHVQVVREDYLSVSPLDAQGNRRPAGQVVVGEEQRSSADRRSAEGHGTFSRRLPSLPPAPRSRSSPQARGGGGSLRATPVRGALGLAAQDGRQRWCRRTGASRWGLKRRVGRKGPLVACSDEDLVKQLEAPLFQISEADKQVARLEKEVGGLREVARKGGATRRPLTPRPTERGRGQGCEEGLPALCGGRAGGSEGGASPCPAHPRAAVG